MDRYISFLSIFSFPFFASLVVGCRRGGCLLLLPLLPLLVVSVVLLPKEPLPTTDPPLPSFYSVYCLEFDSSKIITGSRDRTIKVWSLKTGQCLATFVGHNGSVLCLKFDKDWDLDEANTDTVYPSWKKGTMVTGSSDCLVCVWDLYACSTMDEEGNVTQVVTANVRGVLRGHTGGVLDLRIDSKWIISW